MLADKVILGLNDPNWAAVQGAARDFRSCTRMLAVGPTLFAAHGPAVIYSLHELQFSTVLNLYLCADTPHIDETLYQLLKLTGVVGVTFVPLRSDGALAKIAAVIAQVKTETPIAVVPRVYVYADESRLPQTRLKLLATKFNRAGIVGFVGNVAAITQLKTAVPRGMSLVGLAERPPRDYRVNDLAYGNKSGITELLNVGATQVMLTADVLTRKNAEWAADMVNQELKSWQLTQEPAFNVLRNFDVTGND